MVKALSFKGDKKPKKRKREAVNPDDEPSSKTPALDNAEEEASQDDNWVNVDAEADLSGPCVIVLPTDPVTCLSCDALGKVFALEVENIVEGKSHTAEPHDVRQVWVAGRVAGMEGFTFKGHHGKYLSCDKYGVLSANATAVSPLESFNTIPVPDSPSTFSLQNGEEKFISARDGSSSGPEIRGDAETIAYSTTLHLRMQARFKPKLKANKEEKAHAKISWKELETQAGRKLNEEEVKKLKKARREGNFYEVMVDVRRKGKHDKFA